MPLHCTTLLLLANLAATSVGNPAHSTGQDALGTVLTIEDTAESVDERVEYHPNGRVKSRCKLDREGRLHGKYVEYHDNGETAVEATYKKGELSGKYTSFHADGAPWITTTYKNGVISGKYVERRPDSERTITGVYKRGRREGEFTVESGKETLRVQGWKADRLLTIDGVALHPRSLEFIAETLKEIDDPAMVWGGEGLGFVDEPSGERKPDAAALTLERDRCLRRLMAYRFLAGVAWRDMLVSARFNHHADAAARLLKAVGELGEKPENPGWPKKEFQRAALGAASCNQAYAKTLVEALDQGMSERGTGGVGFRTSLLDPKLLATGFGRHENVNTIWYQDESRAFPPDYDLIAFPPAGYMPTAFFGSDHSWSIELNPANHAPIAFKNDVAVRVFRLDEDWVREGAALELDFTDFYDRTIAFRPRAADCSAGARFEVRVLGIRHDKVGSSLTYFVEFVEPAETKTAGPGRLGAPRAH